MVTFPLFLSLYLSLSLNHTATNIRHHHTKTHYLTTNNPAKIFLKKKKKKAKNKATNPPNHPKIITAAAINPNINTA